MAQIQTFGDFVRMVRRRFLVFFLISTIGMTGAIIYALSLSHIYESTGVIQIENGQISTSMARSTVGSSSMQRLQLIQQRLMARDNLIEVVEEHSLFSALTELPMREKIKILKRATKIVHLGDPSLNWRPDATPTALEITVSMSDPQKAADVANSFMLAVVEENREKRENLALGTLQFFQSEADRVGNAIANLEGEIAVFKRANSGSLPDAIDFQREQMASLEETSLEIERQIIELDSGSAQRPTVFADRIERLEEQRDLVRDRRRAIQVAIESGPKVEQEYSTLNRRLDQLSAQFSIITRNRAEAEMGQMLESNRQAERFEVLEVALPPQDPVGPKRKQIAFFGTLGSMILAVGVSLLIEFMKPAIRTAAQMESLLNLRPVVTIPDIETPRERMRRQLVWATGLILIFVGLPLSILWGVDNVTVLTELSEKMKNIF